MIAPIIGGGKMPPRNQPPAILITPEGLHQQMLRREQMLEDLRRWDAARRQEVGSNDRN